MDYTEELAYEKDASSPLGAYNLTAVTMEQIIAMFNAYMIANPVPTPSLGGLTNVVDAVDSATTGSILVKGATDWSSALPSTLQTIATNSVLGSIKVGSGLTIQLDGTLSWDSSAAYTLPTASNSVLGGIKVGSGLSITGGVLSTTFNSLADNILDWNGTGYVAYAARKLSNPFYAYFYEGEEIPAYSNSVNLDGSIRATGFSALSSGTLGVILGSNNNITQLSGVNTSRYALSASDLLISSYTSSKSTPVYIGSISSSNGQKNQYIKVDDFSDTFSINFSKINLPQGTALKWLSLDSQKNIVFQDAPGGSYVHHTQSALSPTLTGANVLASLVVSTEGHTTAATFRTLTLSDLGFTGATNANYYVHPFSPESADAYKSFSIDEYGHVTFVDDSMTVHTIDDETINGNKTFVDITTFGTIHVPDATVGSFLYVDVDKHVAYGPGPQDTVTFTLKMPNAGSVGARVAAMTAGVHYPTGWTLSAYTGNPNHLKVVHNLGKHLVNVTVFSTVDFTGDTQERQLLASAAYTGLLAENDNSIIIEGLATYTSPLYVHITLTNRSNA